MSLTVISRPENYSAFGNPTIYKIQRKDFLITAVDDSFGLAKITLDGNYDSSFHVDDKIFIGVTNYMALAEVVNVNNVGGFTTMVTTLTYVGGGSGYVNNVTTKALHHVAVIFFDGVGEFPLFNSLEFRFATDETGLAIVDAQVLRYLLPDILLQRSFSTYSEQNFSSGLQYYISYQEKWSSDSVSAVNDSANKRVGYLAALQLPGTNNLGALIVGVAAPASFPSIIQKRKAWKGYPFSICTFNSIASFTFKLVVDGSTKVTASVVAIPTTLFSIDPDDLNLGSHTIELKDNALTTTYATLNLDVVEPDCQSPVMLVGRDSLGTPVHWLFEGNQQMEITNDEGYKYIKMTCAAPNLTADEFTALHQAFAPASLIVDTDYRDMSTTFGTRRHDNKDIFTISPDGTVKTQVTCDGFKAVRDTKSDNGNYFEVTILLPFDQDL